MSHTPNLPHAIPQESASVETTESIRASVIVERRKFPRELPKPDVVELNSDSAWAPFQLPSEKVSDEQPPES